MWRRVVKIEGEDACWLWAGGTSQGYGKLSNSRTQRAVLLHRLSWELAHGPIPDGLCVLHSCDSRYSLGDITYRRCVNPAHLLLGTPGDNNEDARLKGRMAKGKRNDTGAWLRGPNHHVSREPDRVRGMNNPSSRLTDSIVRFIRREYATGRYKQRELGEMFGIGQAYVSKIVLRQIWAYLPDEPTEFDARIDGNLPMEWMLDKVDEVLIRYRVL